MRSGRGIPAPPPAAGSLEATVTVVRLEIPEKLLTLTPNHMLDDNPSHWSRRPLLNYTRVGTAQNEADDRANSLVRRSAGRLHNVGLLGPTRTRSE